MRSMKKLVAGALAAAMLVLSMPVGTFAATHTITSVSIKVGVDITSGDRLPDIDLRYDNGNSEGTYAATNSTKYHIGTADWVTSSTKDMTIGEEPKMKISLIADDPDYQFRGSYQSSNVKITGGTFITARRISYDELEVTLRVKGIKGTYESPEEAYWKESGVGNARWSAPDITSGAYDVYLYRGGSAVKKVEGLKATSYNFYPYMTKKGTYSFKVRTVPFTENEKKFGKRSEWTESDEYYLPEEKVSDGSGQQGSVSGNTGAVGWIQDGSRWCFRYPDGSYLKNTWSLINDKWYLFDENGWMLTGWQQKNGLWYYLNENGDMRTGWLNLGDKWYWLNPYADRGVEGAMATGWITVNNRQYYGDPSGALVAGWYQVEGNWYYFYPGDFTKAVNTVIDTLPVDANGIWHKPQ